MTIGGEKRIYLRSIDEIEARPLVDGYNPFFSPDSQWLGYATGDRMWKIPVTGGMPSPICDVERLRGASWGEDDTILFSDGEKLLRVDENGGKPEIVTDPETESSGIRHRWPWHVPGSDAALITIHKGFVQREWELGLVDLNTKETRTLVKGGTWPLVTPNGYLVFNRYGTLHAAPFDLEDLDITGEVRPVLEDVYYWRQSGFTAAGASANGALSYIPGAPGVRDAELVWIDRSGKIEPFSGMREPFDGLAFSPEGRYLAVRVAEDLEEGRLRIHDLTTGAWHVLPGRVVAGGPILWSPQGKWIFTSAIQNGIPKLVRIAADGSARPEVITFGDLPYWEFVNSIAPDGNLLFQKQVAPGQFDLYLIEPDGDGRPEAFLATPASEASGTFSPEGRWVAYQSFETGSLEIHVRPYPEGAPRITITTQGGSGPFWNPNGEELYYRCSKTAYCVVPVETEPTFSAGEPRVLFEADFLPLSGIRIDVAPDGERFLVAKPAPEAAPQRKIVYIPNWIHELDRIYKEGGIR